MSFEKLSMSNWSFGIAECEAALTEIAICWTFIVISMKPVQVSDVARFRLKFFLANRANRANRTRTWIGVCIVFCIVFCIGFSIRTFDLVFRIYFGRIFFTRVGVRRSQQCNRKLQTMFIRNLSDIPWYILVSNFSNIIWWGWCIYFVVLTSNCSIREYPRRASIDSRRPDSIFILFRCYVEHCFINFLLLHF